MAIDSLEYSEGLNPNTEFLKGRGFWAFYASIIFLTHALVSAVLIIVSPALAAHSLTITNAVHAITTLYAMHWIKGASFTAPFWAMTDAGKYDKLTWWEQLDDGHQNTMKKKVLTTVPLVLGSLACLESHWDPVWVGVNFVFAVIAILGKLPFMHRARIFGINQ